MRKIFLLFVLLCTVASVSAVDSKYSIRVNDLGDGDSGDLWSLPTKVFQTTTDPNIFEINVSDGLKINKWSHFGLIIDGAWLNIHKEIGYGTWFKLTNAFESGKTYYIGPGKTIYKIVLFFYSKDHYFINFQTTKDDKSTPYNLVTWNESPNNVSAFNTLTNKTFQRSSTGNVYSIEIPEGVDVIKGNKNATDQFLIKREEEYFKDSKLEARPANTWSPDLKTGVNVQNIAIAAGKYYKLYVKSISVDGIQFYASTIPPTAPAAFTVTPAVKQNATIGKNIFVGFDAKWTKVASQTGYTINYTLTYKKDGLVQTQDLGDVNSVSLYGIDEGEVAIAAVYTNANDGIVITSDPAKATYTPTKVVNAVAIDAPTQLNRNAEGTAFSATLTWKAPETLPVSGYKVMQADATKVIPAESEYKLVLDANAANYQYTGMANIAISKEKGFTISNLTDNIDGVKVNYIVIPGYRIGNSVKTSISESDYNDDAISVVTYPAFSEITPATATFTNNTTTTGVEGVETGKVAIYPNPTMGEINISGDEAINNVRLFTITGAIAGEFNGNGETTLSIDISNVPAGTYFLKVGTKVTKIIKK